MREFTIQENDSDQRVDKFLMKTLPTLPKTLMYKAIRNKKIKVNRKRCEINQRLQTGDTMQLFLAEEFFEKEASYDFLNASVKLDIVYEDEHLLILNKESGLLVHSDTKTFQDNLMDRILHYLYEKKEYDPKLAQSFTPALCHRIDRNTEGLLIAAKTAVALRFINEKIREREIKKTYLCIVEGVMEQKQGELVLYHQKEEKHNLAKLSKTPKEGYKKICTGYRVLKQKPNYALLEVDLQTGKSHQIRATFGYLHHPLLGDVKYGAKRHGNDYQTLCAWKLEFQLKEVSKPFQYLMNKTFVAKHNKMMGIFESL